MVVAAPSDGGAPEGRNKIQQVMDGGVVLQAFTRPSEPRLEAPGYNQTFDRQRP
jgi:hypothetical protein